MNNPDVSRLFRPSFAKASFRALGFMRIFMIPVGLVGDGILIKTKGSDLVLAT